MNLNYNANNIMAAEKEFGLSFFSAFDKLNDGEVGYTGLMFLWCAGGGSRDEFNGQLQNIEELMMNILGGINDAGFLGPQVNMEEVRKAMDQKKNEVSSTNSGKTTKK